MTPYYQDDYCTIYQGDCREILPSLPKVDLVLTSPPYAYQRDYGMPLVNWDDHMSLFFILTKNPSSQINGLEQMKGELVEQG